MISGATLETEGELFARGYTSIAGIDEVGRGALAGPVSVGVAVVTPQHTLDVEGLIDSKALKESVRQQMVPLIQQWAVTGVGSVSAAEIDVLGMTASLRLAAHRAMHRVLAAGARPDAVLLDGKHDWFTEPETDLLTGLTPSDEFYQHSVDQLWGGDRLPVLPVQTIIKGDFTCASIAAASVVAKVSRDTYMESLADQYPQYGWAKNKGYGSQTHRQVLQEHGATVEHRLSWNLGIMPEQTRQAHIQRAKGMI
ncbi:MULTISPECIES: ribonuclease HII [unclassified Rothia (in: high G+C Gram-positive bacteria)]|uniref:ribonuclease HII n=1 Tax=unclassified Rothia (in: high G+C Gram-positive bacteria) TaxID=2689056 RepID=UPI00195D7A1E|nr:MULTISPECIES: ribonuclease HII [unclassified Rothia (in: high G+C Gram-positive bacteria)]MBM7050905.1 ribonuclease HII [Rothia sp. ZJ1223]QRZ62356.1 ribonuclease HII [Rothia sp. ZJ932]